MRKDYTGQKHYKFTFIEDTGKSKVIGKDKSKRAIWKVKCDCGNILEKCAHRIITGNTKSCGCIKKQTEKSALKTLYNSYKRSAESRNITFRLSQKKFKELVKGDCHYCGTKPKNKKGKFVYKINFYVNGIDRLNSKKGYVQENAVSCCKKCNKMKMNLDENDFILQCRRIVDYNDSFIDRMGDLMHELEHVILKMIETHDLQKGEVLALVSKYIDVHCPDSIEVYEADGTNPVYVYGHKDLIKQIAKRLK